VSVQELYHGSPGDSILNILTEGVIRPSNGEIYFIKNESQLHDGFQYGADISRGAAFVILVRAQVPDGLSPKRPMRAGAPRDTWCFETNRPIKVEVLKLYVRPRPGRPIEIKEGAAAIRSYLQGKTK
jgi:hypothetical protein